MKKLAQLRCMFPIVGLALAALFGVYLSQNLILRQFDRLRLAKFARQISDADRVVAAYGSESGVKIEVRKDQVAEVINATCSAGSARMPDAEFSCKYDLITTFYKGSDTLGTIKICSHLFLIEDTEPPFYDGSEVLKNEVEEPLHRALINSFNNPEKSSSPHQ